MARSQADTIFAVSSGAAPAAIAVLRISGPRALAAAAALAGELPEPRRAGVRRLRGADGTLLDTALALTFPGPDTATGEDVAELHLHGGRAIVSAVEAAIAAQPGLRAAGPGEFTRRALANGRIDLAQAEGLADLLAAETEQQRRAAVAVAEGAVGRAVGGWTTRLLELSARAEAQIDFADEDDVAADADAVAALRADAAALAAEIGAVLANPSVERLHDGVRVVIAGSPNAGKSTLINALAERQVAIATPIAGTTRDRIEAAVTREGVAFRLTDTAGLTATDDPVERIGVGLAEEAVATADILVWLDDTPPPRADALWVQPRADLPGRNRLLAQQELLVSCTDRTGVSELWSRLLARAGKLLPVPDMIALNRRQRELVGQARESVRQTADAYDVLIIAEELRRSRDALDKVTGRSATEAMLDALFDRFCIGK